MQGENCTVNTKSLQVRIPLEKEGWHQRCRDWMFPLNSPFELGEFYTHIGLKGRIPGVKCTIHITVLLSSLSPTFYPKPCR